MDRLDRARLTLAGLDDWVLHARSELAKAEQAQAAARRELEVAQMEAAGQIPVDRTQVEMSGGGALREDRLEVRPDGQLKGYVVLTAAERQKGFVRPVRDAYRHVCGHITTMARDIAETYARDPGFYSSTFCGQCGGHFPVGQHGEFTWYEMDGTEGQKVGT